MGFTFILMSLWGATAHAFPTGLARCPDHEVNPGFQKNADLIHKAAMVGLETRLTRKEFAQLKRRSPRQSLKDALKEVDARHSATGFLNCGGSWMGAILIGKNGLVTAPGHAFFNKADCSPKSQPPGAACRVMFPLTEK